MAGDVGTADDESRTPKWLSWFGPTGRLKLRKASLRDAAAQVAPSIEGSRIGGLDGLRTIAVMIVFCSHYSVYILPSHADLLERVFPGMLGVAIFFTLSGYLISTLLMKEYAAHGSISLKNFYLRRLLRLSPALYLYVGITMICYLVVDKRVQITDFLAALFYVSNYYEIWRHTALYYMPVWSLAIEEHFYILFPLMLLVFMKRLTRGFLPAVVVLLIVQYVWRLHVARQPGMDWHFIYWRTDTRLDALLFGVLLMLATQRNRPTWLRTFLVSNTSLCIGLGLMALTVVYRNETFRMSARYTLQGASLALIIGYVSQNSGQVADIVRRLLDSPPSLYISRISYSLYLWHLTVIKLAEHVFGHVSPLFALLLAGLSFTLAALSYRFVETPFLRLRHRFGSHAAA